MLLLLSLHHPFVFCNYNFCTNILQNHPHTLQNPARKDFDNMNLSSAADVSANNLFGASKTGDETLTNISQTTLNFLLDEKQQAGGGAPNQTLIGKPTPVPRSAQPSDDSSTAPVAAAIVIPGTPVVTPPTPQILSDLQNANVAAIGGPTTTLPAVPATPIPAQPAAVVKPVQLPPPVLETTIITLDDDDSDANDTAVIELSSDGIMIYLFAM